MLICHLFEVDGVNRIFECEPVVLKVNAEKNLARDCGREMKHWREQEKHELVVLLGELAAKRSQNQRISNNLRLSRLSLKGREQFNSFRLSKSRPIVREISMKVRSLTPG